MGTPKKWIATCLNLIILFFSFFFIWRDMPPGLVRLGDILDMACCRLRLFS